MSCVEGIKELRETYRDHNVSVVWHTDRPASSTLIANPADYRHWYSALRKHWNDDTAPGDRERMQEVWSSSEKMAELNKRKIRRWQPEDQK